MGKPKDREGEADKFRREYAHVAQRQIAEQQDEQGNFNFRDAGYDETLPGQEEIQSGSVEHQQVLNSYPTATHYAPDVNVVAKDEDSGEGEGEGPTQPPSMRDTPLVQQEGDKLTCTMGNWDGEPSGYEYDWRRDGESTGDASNTGEYSVTEQDVGHEMDCVVTATNDIGSTEAEPSNSVVVSSPNARR